MIEPNVIKEINRLLKEGVLSQRKIARRLGVSRGTVHAVATGKRRVVSEKRKESNFVPPSGPYARCSICGARVKMPCLACRMLLPFSSPNGDRCAVTMASPSNSTQSVG
jgi:hypothetical protein